MPSDPCADLETFVRGGPTLITFSKRDHRRPASETPFKWRSDDDLTFNAGLVALLLFSGSGPVLLEKLYFL